MQRLIRSGSLPRKSDSSTVLTLTGSSHSGKADCKALSVYVPYQGKLITALYPPHQGLRTMKRLIAPLGPFSLLTKEDIPEMYLPYQGLRTVETLIARPCPFRSLNKED